MRVIEHATSKSIDWKHHEEKAATMSDAELAYARCDAFKAAQALRPSEAEGLYMDECSIYAREQKSRDDRAVT